MSNVPDVKKNLGVHNNKLTTKEPILIKLHLFPFVSRDTVNKEVNKEVMFRCSKFNIKSLKNEQHFHTTYKSSVKTSQETTKNFHFFTNCETITE